MNISELTGRVQKVKDFSTPPTLRLQPQRWVSARVRVHICNSLSLTIKTGWAGAQESVIIMSILCISNSHCTILATILPASFHLPFSSYVSPILPIHSTIVGVFSSEFGWSLGFKSPSRTASKVCLPLTIKTGWAGELVKVYKKASNTTVCFSLIAGLCEQQGSLRNWSNVSNKRLARPFSSYLTQ